MTGVDHIMPEVLRLDADDLQLQWLRIKQQFQDLMQRFAWFGDLFSKLSESTKLDIFLNCLGQEAVELYSDVLKTKENMKYEDIIQLFDDHFASQNELNSRFNFNQRNQQNGESFDEFYTELGKLVKPCQYRDQEEIMLRDRVVSGVLDVNLQRKLLENNSLTLQQAVDICRAHELSNEITALDISQDFKPKNKASTSQIYCNVPMINFLTFPYCILMS